MGRPRIAPLVGITGWYAGLAVDEATTLLAAAIMTRRGRGRAPAWRFLGGPDWPWPRLRRSSSRSAWALPEGVVDDEPGLALWLLTLVWVGLNEEMFSRGIVLTSLRRADHPLPAVAITGALFGLDLLRVGSHQPRE